MHATSADEIHPLNFVFRLLYIKETSELFPLYVVSEHTEAELECLDTPHLRKLAGSSADFDALAVVGRILEERYFTM